MDNTQAILDWIKNNGRYQGAEYVEINIVELKHFFTTQEGCKCGSTGDTVLIDYPTEVCAECFEERTAQEKIHYSKLANAILNAPLDFTAQEGTRTHVTSPASYPTSVLQKELKRRNILTAQEGERMSEQGILKEVQIMIEDNEGETDSYGLAYDIVEYFTTKTTTPNMKGK